MGKLKCPNSEDCLFDYHGQMHSRPSVSCAQRVAALRDGGNWRDNLLCDFGKQATALIELSYRWTGERWEGIPIADMQARVEAQG